MVSAPRYNEAQSAVNELLVAGFNKREVQLSGEDTSTAIPETAPERPRKGLEGYFQSLFGMDRPEENDILIYDEAVRHGNSVVTAIAATDEKSEIATEVLTHHHPVDIDERSSEWLGEGAGTAGASVSEAQSIPVVEEEVKIGKREVQHGGVRIYQRVSEIPVEEDLTLREERVVVERRGHRPHFRR